MLKAIQDNFADYNIEYIIYSGESVEDEAILEKALKRFNIDIKKEVKFVKLSYTWTIQAEKFKIFTMIRQIIGMMVLTIEALSKYPCDIFCDTTGLAFSYCIVKWIIPSSKVITYVHYPFIRYF